MVLTNLRDGHAHTHTTVTWKLCRIQNKQTRQKLHNADDKILVLSDRRSKHLNKQKKLSELKILNLS